MGPCWEIDDPYSNADPTCPGTVQSSYEMCKCCGGTGVQTKNDGIKIKCPACYGTGNWNAPGYIITYCGTQED